MYITYIIDTLCDRDKLLYIITILYAFLLCFISLLFYHFKKVLPGTTTSVLACFKPEMLLINERK